MSSNTVLSNFTLSKEDIISERLNVILQYFSENDEAVYNGFGEVPGIWKCRWYNDPEIKGYDKGDFFWLNTENKSEFFKNNSEEMRAVADIHPSIKSKLPAWKSNDEDIFNAYNNFLTGYIDSSKSMSMPPWAEVGELSACTQLIVSQKNNNKDLIQVLSSWKKFFIDESDIEKILLSSKNDIKNAIDAHEEDYHFGVERNNSATFRDNLETAKNKLDMYANKDFSNTEGMYPENYLENNYASGFDTVKYFVKKPYPEKSLSGHTVEYQWFRLWQSGFLEHGGIIKTSNHLSSGKVSVNFNWFISGDSSKLYDIRYIAAKNLELIEVDESNEVPPGDDLLSVLYELDPSSLDPEISKIKYAPTYYANDYDINITPIYKTEGLSAVTTTVPYENIGNYNATRNIVNTAINESDCKKTGFSLVYDSVNTPEYYSYYATGYSTVNTSV